MITVSARQLGRIIDKTVRHIGGEDNAQLHGLRLDVDHAHVYAVASDQYTLAAARCQFTQVGTGGEPFARTIPAPYLTPLRGWTNAQPEAARISISTLPGSVAFDTPSSSMRIPVTDNAPFPDWRSILRDIAHRAVDGEPLTALGAVGILARWDDTGDILHVRATADQQAALLIGEDFIGAQTTARRDVTFEQVRDQWADILAPASALAA